MYVCKYINISIFFFIYSYIERERECWTFILQDLLFKSMISIISLDTWLKVASCFYLCGINLGLCDFMTGENQWVLGLRLYNQLRTSDVEAQGVFFIIIFFMSGQRLGNVRARAACYLSVKANVPTALRSASKRCASVSRQTQRPGSVLRRRVSLTSGRPGRWSWKTTLCR